MDDTDIILQVYRDNNFDERIKSFLTHGGTASMAARKAEGIIGRIVKKGRHNGFKVGRQTRNGELRIKNCIKYDLGNGYRMVCIKRDTRFIFLYIGTHDECSRWLERNKDLQYDVNNATYVQTPSVETPPSILRKEPDAADLYEENLLKQLDDTTLRKIFSGICERGIDTGTL